MTDSVRKPIQKPGSSTRAAQIEALDAMCKARPLRPPTATRPEVRVVRKPLPNGQIPNF